MDSQIDVRYAINLNVKKIGGNMKQVNDNEALELIEALSHLSPIEFIGLATLLKVPCYEDLEHKVAREADALLGDIIDAYIKMN